MVWTDTHTANKEIHLIQQLRQLISTTELSNNFTAIQRHELVKLFQITIDMINSIPKDYNHYLRNDLLIKYTKLVNSYQKLVDANLPSQLHPASTPISSNTSRKYGIFQDRVSNLSPSISTNSVYEIGSNRQFMELSSKPVQEDDGDSSASSEFEEEEGEVSQDMIYNHSVSFTSPQKPLSLPSIFLNNKLSAPNLRSLNHKNQPQINSSFYSLQ
ncbi:hypothetical protein G210_2287 [Candida maltosa Xu316]|uniref:Uncharacterized protein n=1 Tax=Candida maltosa (strain Xu316) TaxID=1245528 RepID=M3HSJ8_CANMX|nr:hypothetical protein G210_2287 [Candida maltosa Xu316]